MSGRLLPGALLLGLVFVFPLAAGGPALDGFVLHFLHVDCQGGGIVALEEGSESMIVTLFHEPAKAGLQGALDVLVGLFTGQVVQAIRILLHVVEFFHVAVIHGRQAGRDLLISRGQFLHLAIGGRSVGGGPEDVFAI